MSSFHKKLEKDMFDDEEMRLLARESEQGRLNYITHRYLKHKYGITFQEREKKLDEQMGKCAICGLHENDFKRALHVDHDHKTGKIMALLCTNCNQYLGFAKEDVSVLKNMINYIKKWTEERWCSISTKILIFPYFILDK